MAVYQSRRDLEEGFGAAVEAVEEKLDGAAAEGGSVAVDGGEEVARRLGLKRLRSN